MIKNKLGIKITPKQKAEKLLYGGLLAIAEGLYSFKTLDGMTERETEKVKVQVEKLVQRIGKLLHQGDGE